MARATPHSPAPPWGQLYGCLCSQRESRLETDAAPVATDQSSPNDDRPIWTRLRKISSAIFRRKR
jgi:hypothetical protein